MKKKTRTIILIISIFAILLIGGIYAFTVSSIETINISKIGTIGIDLKTYTLNDDNKEEEMKGNSNMITENILKYIPKISKSKNSGDCYIRVKVILKYGNIEKVVNNDAIVNLNENFVYSADEYFYYKNILDDKGIKVFDGIKLENDVFSSDDLSIKVKTDAIQAKNVNVDFSNLTESGPWLDISNEDIKENVASTILN